MLPTAPLIILGLALAPLSSLAVTIYPWQKTCNLWGANSDYIQGWSYNDAGALITNVRLLFFPFAFFFFQWYRFIFT